MSCACRQGFTCVNCTGPAFKMTVPPTNATDLRAYIRAKVDQPRVERIVAETVARCRRFSRSKRKKELARAERRLATCITVEVS